MASYLKWFPNVWLGVSIEDQEQADKRIPLLLQTPAAVRFLSCEPMLGPIDLDLERYESPGWFDYRKKLIHLVIVGGESGQGARPCDIAWIRSIVQQCKDAGVKCFVKQLGSLPIATDSECRRLIRKSSGVLRFEANGDGTGRLLLNDKKGGDMSEWQEDLRVREFP